MSGEAITIPAMVGAETTLAEWLTAGGTVFAALGTVGAVVIALWQVFGQKRAKLAVHCWYGEERREDQRPYATLNLSATHVRGPAVLLQSAYLTTDGSSGPLVGGTERSTSLPFLLHPGQSTQVIWNVGILQSVLEVMTHQGSDDTTYISALFVDSSGRRYEAPLPKIFEKRDGVMRPKYF